MGWISRPNDSQNFFWDQSGNRTDQIRAGTTYNYGVNVQSNRLDWWSGGAQARNFMYDAVGNGRDGNPTTAAMDLLKNSLSKKAGKNSKTELKCDSNADEKKVYSHVNAIANNPNRNAYSWTPWNKNQCRSFAAAAYKSRGENEECQAIADSIPLSLTGTGTGNGSGVCILLD